MYGTFSFSGFVLGYMARENVCRFNYILMAGQGVLAHKKKLKCVSLELFVENKTKDGLKSAKHLL